MWYPARRQATQSAPDALHAVHILALRAPFMRRPPVYTALSTTSRHGTVASPSRSYQSPTAVSPAIMLSRICSARSCVTKRVGQCTWMPCLKRVGSSATGAEPADLMHARQPIGGAST